MSITDVTGINGTISTLGTEVYNDLETYGCSGQAAKFVPIFASMEATLSSDVIAMAGAGSNAATASKLYDTEARDASKLGAEVELFKLTTSGIPSAQGAALDKDFFAMMHGVGSQLAPVNPEAELLMFQSIGKLTQFDPEGNSPSALTPGTTGGGGGAWPAAPAAGGGTFQVTPFGDPGLGEFNYFARPDPVGNTVASPCPTLSPIASGGPPPK